MSNKAKPGEFWTRERCYIAELLNHDGSPEVSIARARVEPGVTTELHALAVAEWYVIESGVGQMTVGDAQPREVRAGDTVSIPTGTAQRIHNGGDGDLVFLCVCVPRFLLRHYTSLE